MALHMLSSEGQQQIPITNKTTSSSLMNEYSSLMNEYSSPINEYSSPPFQHIKDALKLSILKGC